MAAGRQNGAFESVVELPDGYDLPNAKAAYQNGFLRIDVPLLKDIDGLSLSSEGA